MEIVRGSKQEIDDRDARIIQVNGKYIKVHRVVLEEMEAMAKCKKGKKKGK